MTSRFELYTKPSRIKRDMVSPSTGDPWSINSENNAKQLIWFQSIEVKIQNLLVKLTPPDRWPFNEIDGLTRISSLGLSFRCVMYDPWSCSWMVEIWPCSHSSIKFTNAIKNCQKLDIKKVYSPTVALPAFKRKAERNFSIKSGMGSKQTTGWFWSTSAYWVNQDPRGQLRPNGDHCTQLLLRRQYQKLDLKWKVYNRIKHNNSNLENWYKSNAKIKNLITTTIITNQKIAIFANGCGVIIFNQSSIGDQIVISGKAS